MRKKLPRGIRNNNPLNIRRNDIKWKGLSPVNPAETEFAVFESPEMGIRAAAKILQAYEESHGINTLQGIINRWAPPSENDTGGYIQAVEIWADVSRDDVLSMTDYDTVYRLLRAMTRMENGKPVDDENAWYPPDIWEKGLRLGGLTPEKPLSKSRITVSTTTGAAAATAGVGVLTDLLGLPTWLEPYIPQALAGLTEQQIAIGLLLLVGLTQWRTLAARVDDKLKGRL